MSDLRTSFFDLSTFDLEVIYKMADHPSGKRPCNSTLSFFYPILAVLCFIFWGRYSFGTDLYKDGDMNLSFLTTPVDINGDQFADVILTLTKGTGKFLEQEIIIFVFLNQKKPESPES